MKLIYVSFEYPKKSNGAKIVSARNLSVLKKIYFDQHIEEFYFSKPTIKELSKSLLIGKTYGLSRYEVKKFKRLLKDQKPEFVFFEGSLWGALVKLTRKENIKTIIFSHNIEKTLYKDLWRKRKTLKSLLQFLLVNKCERESFNYCNQAITLTDRDRIQLSQIYSLPSENIEIIPISAKPFPQYCRQKIDEPYILFVGSDFEPNNEGINWFISEVAPKIKYNLKVVGTCVNSIKNKKQLPNNVSLEGYVENLEKVYTEALLVVVPIFSGSGMKTKTIEALSYSKTVLGTEEALIGVPLKKGAIIKCVSSNDFIKEINRFNGDQFCQQAFNLFNQFFSNSTIEQSFKNLLINKLRKRNV